MSKSNLVSLTGSNNQVSPNNNNTNNNEINSSLNYRPAVTIEINSPVEQSVTYNNLNNNSANSKKNRVAQFPTIYKSTAGTDSHKNIIFSYVEKNGNDAKAEKIWNMILDVFEQNPKASIFGLYDTMFGEELNNCLEGSSKSRNYLIPGTNHTHSLTTQYPWGLRMILINKINESLTNGKSIPDSLLSSIEKVLQNNSDDKQIQIKLANIIKQAKINGQEIPNNIIELANNF